MWYKQGIRLLMLIHRRKDGGSKRTDRDSYRKISQNEYEFDMIFDEFKNIKEDSLCPLRIYSSVNARNFKKAIRLYKLQQLELEFQNLDFQIKFYKQTKNQFFSCLAKPVCAETKNFLIDFDEKDEINLNSTVHELEKHTKIIEVRTTINGYHIVTEPYNPKLTPTFEIKKDGMILHNQT